MEAGIWEELIYLDHPCKSAIARAEALAQQMEALRADCQSARTFTN